jgi:hypothetical protein
MVTLSLDAAFAVHRGKVRFPRGSGRQPNMAGFADLGRHDVVDRKQPSFLDRVGETTR